MQTHLKARTVSVDLSLTMAGITPDPKKRSYLLPTGCKDLHDVLHPVPRKSIPDMGASMANAKSASRTALAAFGLQSKCSECLSGTLGDLKGHLERMAASDALACFLWVNSRIAPSLGFVRQGRNTPMEVAISVEMGTLQEKAMQDFCIRHEFSAPENTALPEGFHKDLPVSQSYKLSSLPANDSVAASLMLRLMHEVVGIDEREPATFRYNEVTRIT